MKNKFIIFFISLNLFTFGVKAESNVSYTLGYASQYISSGVDYNKSRPAPYASVDYSLNEMFYAGVWTSGYSGGDGANQEVDYYFGVTPSFGDFSFDLSHITFIYPGNTGHGVSSGEFGLTVSYAPSERPYSTDVSFKQGDQGNKDETKEISFNYSFQHFDSSFTYGDVQNSNEFKSLSLSKSISSYDITLSYIDNEMDATGDVASRDHVTIDISRTF